MIGQPIPAYLLEFSLRIVGSVILHMSYIILLLLSVLSYYKGGLQEDKLPTHFSY